MKPLSLKAREILDSRGNPTIEVDLWVEGFTKPFRAAVPSGASLGSKEVFELRDRDLTRFAGKGVLKAVANVNEEINSAIQGQVFQNQEDFDYFLIQLDGSVNKSRLGANAILGCSMAFARALAESNDQHLFQSLGDGTTLPRPMVNIINGGAHADNGLAIQEFMIVPLNFASIKESLRACCEIFHQLKKNLHRAGHATGVGDEGGFAPNFSYTTEALDFIMSAISDAGYTPGEDIAIALDAAASEFYHDGKYAVDQEQLSSEELIDYYANLIKNYPIISIEDGFSEFDHQGWIEFTRNFGDQIQIVGDDIFVTNPIYLREGIERHMANAILIKLNQIGTVTETLATIRMAQEHGFNAIISHRSGETEDVFIAHLAVGSGVGQIKTGSMSRTDRICKYNELLRIDEILSQPIN